MVVISEEGIDSQEVERVRAITESPEKTKARVEAGGEAEGAEEDLEEEDLGEETISRPELRTK